MIAIKDFPSLLPASSAKKESSLPSISRYFFTINMLSAYVFPIRGLRHAFKLLSRNIFCAGSGVLLSTVNTNLLKFIIEKAQCDLFNSLINKQFIT